MVGLQALLMVGFMILYPPFQQSDEAAHIDYVLAHRHGEWLDGPGQRHYQSGVIKAVAQVPSIQFEPNVALQPVVQRADRPSFDALGSGSSDSLFPDQMVQHPPLYYALGAGFTYLLPNFAHQRYDIQVFWLRLFSLLLLLPVPLLIYATAERMTSSPGLGLSAALLPLSIPSYLRTGAAVTNDSLLVLLTTLIIALLARVALGDVGKRTALFVGLAWGAALLTKGFALSLPPVIVAAYCVGAQGSVRARFRSAWPGALVAAFAGTAIGGWWWVRNVVLYDAIQPNGYGTLNPSLRQYIFGSDRPGGTDAAFFRGFFRLLSQRVWGSLGLLDVPSLPHALLELLSALLVIGIILAIVIGTRRFAARRQRLRLDEWTWGRSLILLLPALLTVAVMYEGSRDTFLKGRQLTGIQVRYLEPGLLGLVICAAVAVYFLAGPLARWMPAVIGAGGLLFVGLSVYRVLDIEMSKGGPDRVRRLKDAVRFVVDEGPFPAGVTGALLLATVVAVVATVIALVQLGIRAGTPGSAARLDSGEAETSRYSS